MAEDLKHLLNTIQKEGVEKAEAEAERIVGEAKKKAQALVKDAERKAEEIKQKAEKDSQSFVERGKIELEQAARDLLIAFARGLEDLLRESIKRSVSDSLTPETLKELLVKIGQSYYEESLKGKPSDLYLNEKDAAMLADFFKNELRKMMAEGLVVHIDKRITKGFAIALRNQRFYYDFTQEAITDELCRFLQPQMAEIVKHISSDKKGKE